MLSSMRDAENHEGILSSMGGCWAAWGDVEQHGGMLSSMERMLKIMRGCWEAWEMLFTMMGRCYHHGVSAVTEGEALL
jgi:hypothetical protein